uniref:GTP-binding protein n=1 Tax=Globodera pallida TaxID=36090 RepID=A0A183CKQ7_GLOPA
MTAQRDQIFKNVQVLIYVFDVESREVQKDYRNYQSCLDALMQNSPTAKVFCLVHKMDLIQEEMRDKIFQDKERDINQLSEATALRQHTNPSIQCFRSSIWDETLYNAWSAIVYQLVPNVSSMEHKLKKFADIMDADEILLFEKATFLVIAQAQRAKHEDIHRFEKVSNIIKQFKLSCSRMGSQFEIRNSTFAAFIESFTYNTYVMLVLSDGNVSSAAIKIEEGSCGRAIRTAGSKTSTQPGGWNDDFVLLRQFGARIPSFICMHNAPDSATAMGFAQSNHSHVAEHIYKSTDNDVTLAFPSLRQGIPDLKLTMTLHVVFLVFDGA